MEGGTAWETLHWYTHWFLGLNKLRQRGGDTEVVAVSQEVERQRGRATSGEDRWETDNSDAGEDAEDEELVETFKTVPTMWYYWFLWKRQNPITILKERNQTLQVEVVELWTQNMVYNTSPLSPPWKYYVECCLRRVTWRRQKRARHASGYWASLLTKYWSRFHWCLALNEEPGDNVMVVVDQQEVLTAEEVKEKMLVQTRIKSKIKTWYNHHHNAMGMTSNPFTPWLARLRRPDGACPKHVTNYQFYMQHNEFKAEVEKEFQIRYGHEAQCQHLTLRCKVAREFCEAESEDVNIVVITTGRVAGTGDHGYGYSLNRPAIPWAQDSHPALQLLQLNDGGGYRGASDSDSHDSGSSTGSRASKLLSSATKVVKNTARKAVNFATPRKSSARGSQRDTPHRTRYKYILLSQCCQPSKVGWDHEEKGVIKYCNNKLSKDIGTYIQGPKNQLCSHLSDFITPGMSPRRSARLKGDPFTPGMSPRRSARLKGDPSTSQNIPSQCSVAQSSGGTVSRDTAAQPYTHPKSQLTKSTPDTEQEKPGRNSSIPINDLDFDVATLRLEIYKYSTGGWESTYSPPSLFTIWEATKSGCRFTIHLAWFLKQRRVISLAIKKICLGKDWASKWASRDAAMWLEGVRFAEGLRQWQKFKRCCRKEDIKLPEPILAAGWHSLGSTPLKRPALMDLKTPLSVMP
ncbi:hypothetical protein C8R46DRAFT_1030610 [Mycena filopes]|nr:hypothetical protein C8R46DRAFT_1030610 [Mycena filopes]